MIKLFDTKYLLNYDLNNFYEEKELIILNLLNNEKQILLNLFKKKSIFTTKMHMDTQHILEDVKYLCNIEYSSCQKNENYFTNFKRWRNGTCSSLMEIIEGFDLHNTIEFFFNNYND